MCVGFAAAAGSFLSRPGICICAACDARAVPGNRLMPDMLGDVVSSGGSFTVLAPAYIISQIT